MLDNAPYVGFIPVTDLATARRFFVDTLGLKFVDEDEYALVVSANGTTIRITPVADLRPQPFTIAGWQSDDVAATVGQLKAAGVVFRRYDGLEQDELDIWHAPGGNLIAWFSDLDNNVLSISGRVPDSTGAAFSL